MHGRVRGLIDDIGAVLRPEADTDPSTRWCGALRSAPAIMSPVVFGVPLQAIAAREAPQITLRFADQEKEDVGALREGRIDLDIGVGDIGPEIHRYIVARSLRGGDAQGTSVAEGPVDRAPFCAATHVSASRCGKSHGPIDEALAAQGLSRRVQFVVPGFDAAMLTAAASDIVAAVPLALARMAARLGRKIGYRDLPVETAAVAIAQAWHPALRE